MRDKNFPVVFFRHEQEVHKKKKLDEFKKTLTAEMRKEKDQQGEDSGSEIPMDALTLNCNVTGLPDVTTSRAALKNLLEKEVPQK